MADDVAKLLTCHGLALMCVLTWRWRGRCVAGTVDRLQPWDVTVADTVAETSGGAWGRVQQGVRLPLTAKRSARPPLSPGMLKKPQRTPFEKTPPWRTALCFSAKLLPRHLLLLKQSSDTTCCGSLTTNRSKQERKTILFHKNRITEKNYKNSHTHAQLSQLSLEFKP